MINGLTPNKFAKNPLHANYSVRFMQHLLGSQDLFSTADPHRTVVYTSV